MEMEMSLTTLKYHIDYLCNSLHSVLPQESYDGI